MSAEAFDELQGFLQWFMGTKPLLVPGADALSFYETAVGIVLYRQPPFQVQMFIAMPAKRIAEHTHPNVDSFEIWLHGMEFTHSGNVLVDLAQASQLGPQGIPIAYGHAIRVRPTDTHGGIGGDKGGAFLSVQKWLNGIHPTCVARDWDGDTMGPMHERSITSTSTIH